MDDLDYTKLDPGITEVVRLLRSLGFNTTDSGDGLTKIANGMKALLHLPHVHCTVRPSNLVREALLLQNTLVDRGIKVQPYMIQATYSPVDGVATVSLYGVNNDTLRYPHDTFDLDSLIDPYVVFDDED